MLNSEDNSKELPIIRPSPRIADSCYYLPSFLRSQSCPTVVPGTGVTEFSNMRLTAYPFVFPASHLHLLLLQLEDL